MDWISKSISKYQEIIGAYEKQVWERSLEKAVLKNLKHVTRKKAKVNPDLIDVDLVRGSTFSKTKSHQSVILIFQRSILRVIFLPLYYQWWKNSTSWAVFWLLSLLYALQIASFIIYVMDANDSLCTETLSFAHTISPCLLLLAVAFIQIQIIETGLSSSAAHSRANVMTSERMRKKKKAEQRHGCHSVSEQGSIGSLDTGIDLNPDDLGSSDSARVKPSQYNDLSSKLAPSNITVHSNTDDSTTVHNYRAVNNEADDESEESSAVARSSSKSLSKLRRVSWEKTTAWLLQQCTKSCTDSFGRISLDDGVISFPKGTSEMEGLWDSGNGHHFHVGSKFFRRTSSCVSVRDYLTPKCEHLVRSLSVTDVRSQSTDSCLYICCRSPVPFISDDRQCYNRGVEAYSGIAQNCQMVKTNNTDVGGLTFLQNFHSIHNDDCLLSKLSQEKAKRSSPFATKSHASELESQSSTSSLSGDGKGSSVHRMEASLPVKVRVTMPEGTGIQTPCAADDAQLKSMNVADEDDEDAGCHGSFDDAPAINGSVSEISENDTTASYEEWSEERSAILHNLTSENSKISCFIWKSEEVQRVDLTGFEICSRIMEKVEKTPEPHDDIFVGVAFSVVFMLTPVAYQVFHAREQLTSLNFYHMPDVYAAAQLTFGHNWRETFVIINGAVQCFFLGLFLAFLLSVAHRTFRQRLLYAKNFSALTSSRRTRKYDLPHFRLNKLQNFKTWISVRSFLRRHGPQRSVETIISNAFIVSVIIVSVISIQLLQNYDGFLDHLINWELVTWGLALGIYLMKFVTIGMKINQKYHNLSVLITEQINLYLHMEHKPHKKDELMMANSVLRLAEGLLKELESPFRVSGLSGNPLLYNLTKLIVLSAFSAVLTELLGFKLKLYKINLCA